MSGGATFHKMTKMHFVMSLPEFLGAVTIAFGVGIGWTAGCWVASLVLGFIRR